MGAVQPRLGILGGLGPLASADFYRRLVELTPAAADRDHLPLVLLSLPQTPDRSRAILGEGPSPLPALLDAVGVLDGLGVECIAITCNSAHHWYDDLAARSRARILHIADSAVAALAAQRRGGRVAVLATAGTVRSGFYQRRLAVSGFTPVEIDAATQDRVGAAIAAVKAGRIEAAGAALAAALVPLSAAGTEAVLLACTELPIAFAHCPGAVGLTAVDANDALARDVLTSLGYPVRASAS